MLGGAADGLGYIVLPSHLLDVGDDLQAQGRVEAAGGFVEEQDLGVGDESAGDAEALLLAAAEALLDGGADDGVCLVLQAEAGDEVVDTPTGLSLGDGAGTPRRAAYQRDLSFICWHHTPSAPAQQHKQGV